MLTRLVYASSACSFLGGDDLAEILRVGRQNNAEADVTGALLYTGGNFMQILEGSVARVTEVYRRIEVDRRHHGHVVLLRDPIGTRLFPESPLAFYSFGQLSEEERGGTRSLFDPSFPDRERARLLLRTLHQLGERELVESAVR